MVNSTAVQLETQLTTGPAPVVKPRPTQALLREALTAFNVTGSCRAVAWELFSYWSPDGAVFPSLDTLAAGVGIQRRGVRKHLAWLERIGLWVRVPREGRANVYELRLPETVLSGGRSSGTGGGGPQGPGGRSSGTAISNHLSDQVRVRTPLTPPEGGLMGSPALIKPRRQKRAERQYREWWSETHLTPLPDDPSDWPRPEFTDDTPFIIEDWFKAATTRRRTRSTDGLTLRIDQTRRERKLAERTGGLP